MSADLFQRVLTAAVQAEVEPEDLRVTRGERPERRLDFLGEEALHRPLFGIALLVRDESIDQRAIAVGVERCVEPHLRWC